MREITFDLVKKEVRLNLNVWVGDLDSEEHEIRERYQLAELKLQGLGFWVSGPSDPDEFPITKNSLCIDISVLRPDYDPGIALPAQDPSNPTYCLYSTDINTCFFFTCQSASVQWL
ncbi:MAG TPA: hypothetical protein VJ623_14490 [Holophagaceae bacterium]|nr:hypothetical protein [Holophagaceae bacterium]